MIGYSVMAEADPNATALIKLFTDACLNSHGKPESVRAYAAKAGLREIDDWGVLPALVGDGDNGIAWEAKLPDSKGNFALSLRGGSGTCAAWAQTATPRDLETQFRDLVEGLADKGMSVAVEREELIPTRTGQGALISYRVVNAANQHFLVSLVVGDKAGSLFNGAPFQATVQFATTSAPE